MNDDREAFEAWARYEFYDDIACPSDTWDNVRRCYSDYAHHMAYHAWQAAKAQAALPTVDELLAMAVECGLIRLSKVRDADLQDALAAFAKRLAAPSAQVAPQPAQAALPSDAQIEAACKVSGSQQTAFEAGCEVLDYLRKQGAGYYILHRMNVALHGNPDKPKSKVLAPQPEAQPHQGEFKTLDPDIAKFISDNLWDLAAPSSQAEPQKPSLMCQKCGVDRLKAACPKGHSAALTGDCPMVAKAQAEQGGE